MERKYRQTKERKERLEFNKQPVSYLFTSYGYIIPQKPEKVNEKEIFFSFFINH